MFEAKTYAYEEQLCTRLLLECDELLTEADLSPQLAEVDAVLMQMIAPQNILPNNPNNICLTLEARVEQVCIDLERLGVSRPEELTLYAFYSRVRHNVVKPKAE